MEILGNTLKPTNLMGKTLSIALILILTISSAVAIMPKVNAQYTASPTKGSNGLWNVPTWPGLTVAPSPVGVGQAVQVIMVLTFLPASTGVEAKTGVYGGWHGFMLTITDPNGKTTTMGPYESDVTGTYQVSYTPDTVGTYTFQFTYPGETVANTYWGGISGDPMTYNANFLASTSEKVSVTVQQAPATGYAEAPVPLPTQYWSSPIDAQNRYWNVICGPWLQSGYNNTGAYNPYTYAPQSAHILWTQSMYPTNGGLIGGAYGSLEFARSTGFSLTCVMDGYMYYSGPVDASSGTALSYFYCANMQTGQVMWREPGSITCGQILNWRSQQSKSEIPYLWSIGATTKLYDARTGALLDQWTDGQSGTVVLEPPNPAVIGQDIGGAGGGGALLIFSTGHVQGQSMQWVSCWNSTKALNAYSGTTGWAGLPLPSTNPVVWSLPPVTATLNWKLGLMWNTTFPWANSLITEGGVSTYVAGRTPAWSISGADLNYVIIKSGPRYDNSTGQEVFTLLSLNAKTGVQVWNENITVPAYDMGMGTSVSLRSDGNIIMADNNMNTISDYSESTGALLWTIAPYNNDFSLQSKSTGTVANGILYNPGYDGYMHAINTTTGVQIWDSISRSGGLEMPQPAYPMNSATVAGGEVFSSTSKSYEAEPLYRGHCLYAYDATTGAQNWNISGQFSIGAIADGILIGTDSYDAKVYAFARGPTATTASATLWQDQKIVISGTVTDQTPTTQAKGTPAISDAWMTPWMQYLYMDQPYPSQATGVNVVITAIDPNHNLITIGNATSDTSGAYSYTWTPPNVSGTYNIIATFNSDNSYYGSCAETAAYVASATSATPAPTATPTSVADTYFMPAIAGIIVVIIIGFIVLALLMLRKRP